jgi:hypothetical protein
LFDGWSVEKKDNGTGNPWLGHPFNSNNNINGVDGDLNHNDQGEETHTLQSPAITALQEAYVRKVIDTVDDLDNVLYEISNESPSNSQDWQYHMINYIKGYEASKPKQHPVGMTVEYPGGDNSELFASPADWISPNEVGGYKDDPPAADGSKVIIADTDHLWGIGGDRQWMWKSFTRGINILFMDCYKAYYCEGVDPNDPDWVSLRKNMGYALSYAGRMNLEAMEPHGELASSGFALANPATSGAEYLVYIPMENVSSKFLRKAGIQNMDPLYSEPVISDAFHSVVQVDLSAASGMLAVEWLDPVDGRIYKGGSTEGGAKRSFSAPFDGDAILYIHQ